MFLSHIQESNQKFHYFYPQEPCWDKIVTENTGFVDLPERIHGLPAEKWHKIINLTLAGNKSFFLFFPLFLFWGLVWLGSTMLELRMKQNTLGFISNCSRKGQTRKLK
jgi:hypothetical protein